MGDVLLTKSADSLLKVMYAEYLSKVESGKSGAESSYFGTSEDIQKKFLPNASYDDVHTAIFMLKRNGLVTGIPADNMLVEARLTPEGIAYCETRWKRNLTEIREWIAAIGGALPF